jgi:hypothetical protein
MFTLKQGRGGGIHFLNETSACGTFPLFGLCIVFNFLPGIIRRIGQEYSANVAFSIFQSLNRIQPLPICAGFFICIRNSLDRNLELNIFL